MRIIFTLLLLIIINLSYAQDTTKVIMLYSDTALTDLYGVDDEGEEYSELGLDEYSYWRKGYMVGEIFLDEEKRRIPTTNLVWFYKKIK